MDNKNIEAVDSVKNHEEVAETNTELETAKARIAELEEVAKNNAIKARLAKKEAPKSGQTVDSSVIERLNRMEMMELGVKDNEEVALVNKEALELGVDPLLLVKKGLAESFLAKHRKAKADELATPGTSSRASVSTRDSAEYWIAKGELPPKDQVELRAKVVNQKLEKSKKSQMFNY